MTICIGITFISYFFTRCSGRSEPLSVVMIISLISVVCLSGRLLKRQHVVFNTRLHPCERGVNRKRAVSFEENRKGYINTVFTDINVALITYTLQGIYPPSSFRYVSLYNFRFSFSFEFFQYVFKSPSTMTI